MKQKQFIYSAISFLFLGLLNTFSLNGQNQTQTTNDDLKNIYAIGKYDEDKVVLRWTPKSAIFWEEMNEVGYFVDRLTIPEKAADMKGQKFERITPVPLKPAPEADWEIPAETDDAVAAAYMMVYGERPEMPVTDIFAKMQQQKRMSENAFFVAMTSAQLSKQAGDLLGIRLEDTTVKSGERYLYRVYAAGPIDVGVLDTATVFVSSLDKSTLNSPILIQTFSEEKQVSIKWNVSQNKASFFAYHIERSNSPDGPYTRLNKEPLLFLNNPNFDKGDEALQVFTDSVGVNYQPFYYRLIGIDHFAEESQPSTPIKGMGVDKTPPYAPIILKHDAIDGKRAYIKWEKEFIEPDLAGYILGRSNHPSGVFMPLHKELLPIMTTEFTDLTPDPEQANFYEVAAVDTAGNITRSLSAYVSFPDLTPPEPPVDLMGSVDTNGIVTLHWTPNTEKDLLGYRVYWANDAEHRFIMVSSEMVTDSTYQHQISLKTLTEKVYYRIAAVDVGYGHSDFSPILELKRPDVVPPSSGSFKSYKLTDEGVELMWNISSSWDMESQELLRRKGQGEWEIVQEMDKTVAQITDEFPEEPGEYEYALRTIDDDGLLSDLSASIGVSLTLIKELSMVEGLEVNYLKDKNTLELKWNYEEAANHRFVIYRSINGGPLRSYESVSGATQFLDVYLPKNGTYAYAVRAMNDASGFESALAKSNTVAVGE